MSHGLVVGGTTSDAGKSLLTAALCRWLRRQGVRVAPFKAQNMSNNSMVVPGGAEVGRAQWLQAVAAGVAPEADMNPVLLKPGSDMTSHVVLCGKPAGTVRSGQWRQVRPQLAAAAFEALERLRSTYDVVIAEGAGSPAEINLRTDDFTNLGLAAKTRWPMIVVGDIDRGGVLAAFYGTLGVVNPDDQKLISGWVVNKFRGSRELLQPGLDQIADLTGRPVLGVVPYLPDLWLDVEDSLSATASPPSLGAPAGGALTVAVVRYPRVSNSTDLDALAVEPGVQVQWTRTPDQVRSADVVVLPGSRATVSDMAWLRKTGLAAAVIDHASAGKPVLGMCGGYQMLAHTITDNVESDVGTVDGLGLLPTDVEFSQEKTLGTPIGQWRGHPVAAYEIHHGTARRRLGAGDDTEPFLDGWQRGTVWGTTWHGAFENDAFRRAWLKMAAAQTGSSWQVSDASVNFAGLRETMLDRLADAVEQHVDTDHLWRLIDGGVPDGLPTKTPGFGREPGATS